MDVGTVEMLDHLGGATADFDGLEDAKGDQGAATFVVQAVPVNDEDGSPARRSLPGGLAAPPRTRPSTISRTPHPCSQG